MAKGPQYTVADLFQWFGFIGGTCITYLALQNLATEWHRFVNLGIAVVVGICTGAGSLMLYRRWQRPKPMDQGWAGDEDLNAGDNDQYRGR